MRKNDPNYHLDMDILFLLWVPAYEGFYGVATTLESAQKMKHEFLQKDNLSEDEVLIIQYPANTLFDYEKLVETPVLPI